MTDDVPVAIGWSTAHVSARSLQVAFDSAPDSAWRCCAAEIARVWEHESRGQTWSTLTVRDTGLYVSGLQSDDASRLQQPRCEP